MFIIIMNSYAAWISAEWHAHGTHTRAHCLIHKHRAAEMESQAKPYTNRMIIAMLLCKNPHTRTHTQREGTTLADKWGSREPWREMMNDE